MSIVCTKGGRCKLVTTNYIPNYCSLLLPLVALYTASAFVTSSLAALATSKANTTTCWTERATSPLAFVLLCSSWRRDEADTRLFKACSTSGVFGFYSNRDTCQSDVYVYVCERVTCVFVRLCGLTGRKSSVKQSTACVTLSQLRDRRCAFCDCAASSSSWMFFVS